MAKTNKYYQAKALAELRKSSITASWGKKDMKGYGAAIANRAFCLYYDARTNINGMSAKNATLKAELAADLDKAAVTGWTLNPFSVADLEDAFDHLIKHHDHWKDEGTTRYWGSTNRAFPYYAEYVPLFASHFLGAVEDRNSAINKSFKLIAKHTHSLNQRLKTSPQGKAWEEVHKDLSTIQSQVKRVHQYLWLAPETVQTALSGGLSHSMSVMDYAGQVHQALTLAVSLRAQGTGAQVTTAMAAAQLVVSRLPALGGLYAAALAAVPSMIQNVKGMVRTFHSRAWSAGQGASPGSASPSRGLQTKVLKRCPYCLCMVATPCTP